MKNREYEGACVAAANEAYRNRDHNLLRQYDKAIADSEATTARLQEARRELVNRLGLNKPESV